MKALVNGRVLLPHGLSEDVAVVVDGDRIAAVSSVPPDGAELVDLGGGLLLPGLVDTQVNGGGGLLFNDAPTVATVTAMAAAHRAHGTTALLPTLISDEPAAIEAAIRATDEAIAAGVPGIVGRHIEGPFLNPERRGIHRRDRLRVLDDAAVRLLSSARHGRTLVTLAPECADPAHLRALAAAGVVVAGGHSQATHDQALAAAAAGMTGVTHLFNAMPWPGHREPGLAGATLDDPRLYAGLIVDGHHLHPATVRLAWAAKGRDRLMLVTDAMSLAGVDADRFVLQGTEIRLEGGRLVDAAGTLAGSALTMLRAVRLFMEQGRVGLADAVATASATPAAFLRLDGALGAIVPGLRADLILVDDALTTVRRSWIGGRE